MVNGMNTCSAQRARQVGDDLATLVRGGDVEEDELVGALGVVARRELHGVAGVTQVDEVDTLHHPPVAHVEAGDDALHVHPSPSLASRHAGRQPAKTICASASVKAFS